MAIGWQHVIGIALVLILIAGVGLLSGRRVKNAADFTTGGGKAGALMVCGTILGSLLSGQATVGTAQMAYTYGLSAWWFTLGAGLGCLVLVVGYAVPLRRGGQCTLLQVVSEKYGAQAGTLGSILCSLGIFISVVSQVLAACALLTTIFPMNTGEAVLLSLALMTVYVVFGGAWGAGMGGIVKMVLLYAAGMLGLILVLSQGGVGALLDHVKAVVLDAGVGAGSGITNEGVFWHRFTHLFARGVLQDAGSGLSLLLGVLSTQTYAQAIWSARSDNAARKGALLSAFLMPVVGLACIGIGLFMRGHSITEEEAAALIQAGQSVPEGLLVIGGSAQAFPAFIVHYMPGLVGGIALGALLIAVVGGGAGLSLGVATILVNDIYTRISPRMREPRRNLIASRATIVAVLAAAGGITAVIPGAIINDFGFLSMALRGAVVFVPLTFALFYPRQVDSRFVWGAIVMGPCAVLAGKLSGVLPFDPLFLGLAVALFLMILGALAVNRRGTGNERNSSV